MGFRERGGRGLPRRPVIGFVSAVPVWVRLSSWSQTREPFETANIPAKSTARSKMKSRNPVILGASLTASYPQATFRAAYQLRGTGTRAGLDVVRRLLRRDWKDDPTDEALLRSLTSSRAGHASIYHIGYLPEDCRDENLKAMCQRCHLRYDLEHHQQNAYQTRRKGKAEKDLFA